MDLRLRKRYGRTKLFGIAVFLILVAASITCGLCASYTHQSAEGVKPPYMSAKVLEVNPAAGIYSYDFPLQFAKTATSSGGNYIRGDFYSSQDLAIDVTDSLTQITTKPNVPIIANIPLNLNGNLAQAIRDGLVTVSIQTYFKLQRPTVGFDLPDSSKLDMTYYCGKINEASEFHRVGGNVKYFGESAKEVTSPALVLDDIGVDSNSLVGSESYPPYLSLKLYDFANDGNFAIAFEEVGFRITFNVKTGINLEVNNVVIHDLANSRHPKADSNTVKPGDIIEINMKISTGNAQLTLSETVDASGTANDGKFYRRMFMVNGDDGPLPIIDYKFMDARLKRIEEFTDAKGKLHSIKGKYSGAKVYFVVQAATAVDMVVEAVMMKGDGETALDSDTVTFYLDSVSANAPTLRSTNKNDGKPDTFYEKYIKNKGYYTDRDTYMYESITLPNGAIKEMIAGINLGKSTATAKPLFNDASLELRGGSSATFKGTNQTIYYKVTRLNGEEDTVKSQSEGFDVSESTGVYCDVIDVGGTIEVTYRDLHIDLAESRNAEGKATSVYADGVYSVEFLTVDYVGNASHSTLKYFIRVDVSDYEFKTNLRLADGSELGVNNVTVTYRILKDNNMYSEYFNAPTFKRGDRVQIRVKFISSSAYNEYILSAFKCTTTPISLAGNVFDSSYSTLLNQSQTIPYTFEVSNTYNLDPATRVLNITFKKKASIVVSGTTQTFTGEGKSITTQVRYKEEPISARPVTTYATSENGTYTTTFPVSAGTYFYISELDKNLTYYAIAKGTFTILPAVPDIGNLHILDIDYGQSLATLDFNESIYDGSGTIIGQQFNNSISAYYAKDGKYYSNMSCNGIYGYYMLTNIDKNGNQYTRPSAGMINVTVTFIPIKTEQDKNGNVVPIRTGGRFVVNTDYTQPSMTMSVRINHSDDVSLTVDGAVNNVVKHSYDGNVKTIHASLRSLLAGETNPDITQYLLIYYREKGSTGEYLLAPPTDAGEYDVRIQINSNRSNYVGEWTYTLSIDKRLLNVTCDNATFVYQNEQPPIPVAKYGSDSAAVEYGGLNYIFEYYFYRGGANADSAVDGNRVPESEIFAGTGMPENAGEYVVKILLNEKNFRNNVAYSRVKINKVLLGNTTFTLSYPSVAYNNDSRDAHVSFKQKLDQAILNVNVNTIAKYVFHIVSLDGSVRTEIRTVPGKFILVTRKKDSSESIDEYKTKMQNEVMDSVGLIRGMYTCFIPDDSRNFDLFYRETDITVGRAKYDLSKITIDPIIYGTTVGTISDVTIQEFARILLNKSKGEYMTIDPADPRLGYKIELLYSGNPVLYPVGEYYLDVKVTPNDATYCESANYSLILRVNKRELNIEFTNAPTDGEFRYTYKAKPHPSVRFTGLVNSSDVVIGDYIFYNAVTGARVSESELSVGTYRGVFSINDKNYVGQKEFSLRVLPDSVKIGTMPSIFNENVAVSYNQLMQDILFIGGLMRSNNTAEEVRGKFSLDYGSGTRFTQTGIRTEYKLVFTPDDTVNYVVYRGTVDRPFVMNLTVSKTDLSPRMTLDINRYVYGELLFNYDLASVLTFTTPVWKTEDGKYWETQVSGATALDVVMKVSSRPSSGRVNAGYYQVTVTVDDPNYAGSISKDLVVDKKSAAITVTENEKVFSNRSQSVSYTLKDVDDNTLNEIIQQSFYQNGIRLLSAPSEIGKYEVEIVLISNNYTAETVYTDFTIQVDVTQITVTNTEQTYNIPRTLSVSLGLNTAVYRLSFEDKINNKTYTALPTDAGEYRIMLTFSPETNFGYAAVIEYRQPLIIHKFTATIVVGDLIAIDYTGRGYTLNIKTEPSGLDMSVEYLSEYGDQYSPNEVLEANTSNGIHKIRLTIEDKNYRGEKIINYKINPATLNVVSAPRFEPFVYNSGKLPAIAEDGRVDFGSSMLNLGGNFSLSIGEINTLSVGIHRAQFTFIAYKDGAPDTNFKPAVGQTELVVVRQTVGEDDILIGEKSGSKTEYNGRPFVVDARVTDGLVYDPDITNADFSVRTYYANLNDLVSESVNPPSYPGEYRVRAVISSKNYVGEKIWEKTLTIDRGTPEIYLSPVIRSGQVFNIGDTLTINDLSGGKARIFGTSKDIGGVFSVQNVTFTKANLNLVEITFIPFDNDSFTETTVSITVDVNGENILKGVTENEDWTGKTISVDGYGTVFIKAEFVGGNPVYGAQLSDFRLKFVSTTRAANAEDFLNQFGLLTFENKNNVLNVGEKAKIVYTPYGAGANQYNIMTGYLDVGVEKAEMDTDVLFTLNGFNGKTLGASVFELTQNGEVLHIDGTWTIFTDENMTNVWDKSTVLTADMHNANVYFRFQSNNYHDVTGQTYLLLFINIGENDILTETLSKNYDGIPLTPSDLGLSVADSERPISPEDYTIKVYQNGQLSVGVDVGTYTIIIYIRNAVYYGTKTVEFTVDKRDISSSLSLNKYNSMFASVTSPVAMLDGTAMPAGTYSLFYKVKDELDSTFSANLPVNAGEYVVQVRAENDNFFGLQTFDFTVNKLAVRLISDNVVTFPYGGAIAPTLSFRHTDNENPLSLDYEIYYYSATYAVSKERPVNAGTYTARIALTDGNYTLGNAGYAEITYVISQMKIVISEIPNAISLGQDGQIHHIIYGQSLGEVTLVGGKATRNGVDVDGTFALKNGTDILNAGLQIVGVVFTPTDKNYAPAEAEIEISIGKSNATVLFDNLSTRYNGTSRRTALTYTVSVSGLNITIEFCDVNGLWLSDPVIVGDYTLRVSTKNSNYNVTAVKASDGISSPIFQITKAPVRKAIPPKAVEISVGESLEKSSLNAGLDYGLMYYEGFTSPVMGKFYFVDGGLVFRTAGTFVIQYRFEPNDGTNYAGFIGETEITIRKASASVAVSNNTYTYSEGFKLPEFNTNPAGLKIAHDVTFREYDPKDPGYVFDEADIVNVGTYYFNVWIEDENYRSDKVQFSIIIVKKKLDIDFLSADGSGNSVPQYMTTYGKQLNAKIQLYRAGNAAGKAGYLLKDEYVNGKHIATEYEVRYMSAESGIVYDNRIPPTNIGTYSVTVNLDNKNYYGSSSIIYKVERGKIESVYFDNASLEQQIYKKPIVPPIVTTSPAGVSYYIVYQGHNTEIPKDAGSYNITVYFNDNNYEKMQVSAMFKINKKPLSVKEIFVENKVYDGVPTLKITGKLDGLLFGDEVSLTMTAATRGNETGVGYHYVDILSYELKGQHAGNYDLAPPVYLGQIYIGQNKVLNAVSNSFITSSTGFMEGTTVDFTFIDAKETRNNFFEKITGRDKVTVGYTIKQNGAETAMKDMFKVYVLIPEAYRNVDFEVFGIGDLAASTVTFTREGNYITFHASGSGQIVFEKTEFRFEFIVIIAAIFIFVVGIIVLLCLNPMQNRKKVTDDSEHRAAAKRIKRGY